MNEVVSLPPFGIQMAVLETRIRQDPLYSVLQVELIDSMSEILDKELVLTYGTHTDLRGELSAGVYEIEKELFAPRSAYPPTTLFNNNVTFPATSKKFRKNYGDGKNAIGFGRLTLKKKVEKISIHTSLFGSPCNIHSRFQNENLLVFGGTYVDLSGIW